MVVKNANPLEKNLALALGKDWILRQLLELLTETGIVGPGFGSSICDAPPVLMQACCQFIEGGGPRMEICFWDRRHR